MPRLEDSEPGNNSNAFSKEDSILVDQMQKILSTRVYRRSLFQLGTAAAAAVLFGCNSTAEKQVQDSPTAFATSTVQPTETPTTTATSTEIPKLVERSPLPDWVTFLGKFPGDHGAIAITSIEDSISVFAIVRDTIIIFPTLRAKAKIIGETFQISSQGVFKIDQAIYNGKTLSGKFHYELPTQPGEREFPFETNPSGTDKPNLLLTLEKMIAEETKLGNVNPSQVKLPPPFQIAWDKLP